MRIPRARYFVTFNGQYHDSGTYYEVGESREGTTDYVGDTVEELVKEVTEDSPNLTWERRNDDGIIGVFVDKEDQKFFNDGDECIVALLIERD